MSDSDPALEGRDDQALARVAQAGDTAAWRVLVERHVARLAAYLGARIRRPLVVEKLVAETIYAAWRHLGDFDPQLEFGTWFRRIGAHVAMRWHNRHPGEPLTAEFPIERCEDPTEHADMTLVDQALGQVPESSRMALEQHYRAGLSGVELGRILHVAGNKADDMVEEGLIQLDLQMRRLRGET